MDYSRDPLWKRVLGCLLLPLLVPLAIVVIPILSLLGLNKMRAKPDYLIEYLEKFIAGEDGRWDWDDFCSIPLKDPLLDDIRERACGFAPPGALSEADRDQLRVLLEEARALAAKADSECS